MFQHSRRPLRWLWRELITAAILWGVSAVCQINATSQWPTGLAERLSSGSEIYYPGSEGFIQATERWSEFETPGVSLVVVPNVENDVAEIVKYANENNMSYLAVTGGHGAITTQANMQNGIEIWMTRLNTVEVIDEKSARIGGGALSKTVTHTLWAAGKQTVTGGCECTSLLGPGLGGGHGFLQGRHGLVSDQFLSIKIVLADGTVETIDKTSDLWWAVQGAGHNFGIVTSVSMKIYDIQHRDWAYEMFTFTGEKVELLYENINANILKNGSPPVDVTNIAVLSNIPATDTKPVIRFWVFQEGATSVDSAYTKPFHELGPAATNASSGTYLDMPRWLGWDSEAATCQHLGVANTRFPVYLQSYNSQSIRKVYDLFTSVTQDNPALNGSRILFEGYSLKGMKAVPSKLAAYPFRGDNLLVAPLVSWTPSGRELSQKAADFGNSLRQILHDGTGRSELHAYVNYAFGDETPKNWYGYEHPRQQRLLSLKNKYDPDRRFSFYAPIA
ncbi:putative FAD-dependent oxygenase [Xylariaceae sp. FL1651]|nr:putative FAD-dependent oxygenase [Xylariaceae sp. FL1651]